MHEKKSPRHKENQLNSLPLALTYAVGSAVLMIGALSLATLIQATEKEGRVIAIDYEPQGEAMLVSPRLGIDVRLTMSVKGSGNIVFGGQLKETRVTVDQFASAEWSLENVGVDGSIDCKTTATTTEKTLVILCER